VGVAVERMATTPHTREEAIRLLKAADPRIRELGVGRLALFGSVLRGDAGANSDVDLLVEFGPGAKSFDRFLALSDLLEEVLGRPVELVTREALSPFIGPWLLSEAEDVLLQFRGSPEALSGDRGRDPGVGRP
jgi:uncharacterized protein